MANFEDFKLAVEALSGGKNTVILDEIGMPSIVVPFAKIKYSDVISGGAQEVLPAFLVDGQEKAAVYVSKYGNVIIIVNDNDNCRLLFADTRGVSVSERMREAI